MTEQSLIKYDEMCHAIAECHRVDEVKEIRDRAMAVKLYAKQAGNYELEQKAAEIRLRAERRCGELLIEMDEKGERAKSGEAGGGTDGKGVRPSVAPTLSDLGITKQQSSQFQQLAEIPEDKFAELVASCQTCQRPPTAQYIISEYERGIPPEEFLEVDENIETEHECPRCHFKWSGKPKSGKPKQWIT